MAHLFPSCYGLQKLIDISSQFGFEWDIKFNPSKSQITTFGGANPHLKAITLNGLIIPWCDKIKYLGVVLQCKTGATDSNNSRKFYSQVNNIVAVTGKSPQELCTLHLVKTYCLPVLLYGCDYWQTNRSIMHKVNVAWNNCFRRIFSCFWQQSVKSLQFFTGTFCMSSVIDQSRLVFWKQMNMSHNKNLSIPSRFVLNRFVETGSVCGINHVDVSINVIKNSIWATFAGHVLQSL